MGIKITKTTAGSVQIEYNSTYSELYSNLTNVSVIANVSANTIDIKWNSGDKQLYLTSIESINGAPAPTDLQAVALLLIDTVFKFGGDGGEGPSTIVADDITDASNIGKTVLRATDADSVRTAINAVPDPVSNMRLSVRDMGSWSSFPIQTVGIDGDSIVMRKAGGAVAVGYPVTDLDATPRGYVDSKILYGSTVVPLNGTDTIFNIPHGMGSIPKSFGITFSDATNLNFVQSHRDIDNTNIIITCNDAPAMGTQKVFWQVFK